jgi:hypothetical protein
VTCASLLAALQQNLWCNAQGRIGAGPIVNWQWRTDVLPRLQHVESNTVTLDWRSEEGEMLIRWGFKPQLLGYIPNVRGAVTGVP